MAARTIPAAPNNKGLRGVAIEARSANDTAPQAKHHTVAIISQVFSVNRAASFLKKVLIAWS